MLFICRVTFKRVIRKKSTEEFSCIPYIIGLLNCLLYTWYGLPIVSCKWENFPIVTVNGVGILLELSYVLIYFWFASRKGKVSQVFHAFKKFMLILLLNHMQDGFSILTSFAEKSSYSNFFFIEKDPFPVVQPFTGPFVARFEMSKCCCR